MNLTIPINLHEDIFRLPDNFVLLSLTKSEQQGHGKMATNLFASAVKSEVR